MFGRIFRIKRGAPRITLQEALAELVETEEMLMKKQNYLDKQIQQEIQIARNHASWNKRIALQALKRRKQHENQLQHIDKVLHTIGYQKQVIDNAIINTQFLRVMDTASRAMNAAQNDMNIDRIYALMEDIAQQQDIANEIAQAISYPATSNGVGGGFGNYDIDEDELLAELRELETDDDVDSMPQDDISTRLPDVPNDVLPVAHQKKHKKKKKSEDDEWAELKKWAHS